VNKSLSRYLDAIRLTAALVVFVGHLSSSQFTGGLGWQAAGYMGDAVTAFFVLSGFLIAHATRREVDARSYAVARLARLASVALPALALTFALDAVGRTINPTLYATLGGYAWDGRAWQAGVSLLFANQWWLLDTAAGSDLPYWSMSFEAAYYVLFGLVLFAQRAWRWAAVAAVLLIVGPQIAVLLPVWLLGVLAYRCCGRIGPWAGAALCIGTLAAAVILDAVLHRHALPFASDWLPRRPMVLRDYLFGTLFALHLIGAAALAPALPAIPRQIGMGIQWAAGGSFTLYLLHYPVAMVLAAMLPWPAASWPARAVMFGGTLLAVMAVASVTERRKDAWRRKVAWLLHEPGAHWKAPSPSK